MTSFPTDLGLLVIVPSRGRPESVRRVTEAWRDTHAARDASLVFVIDADDPRHGDYLAAEAVDPVHFTTIGQWVPMVPKLNLVASAAALSGWKYISFMGDDHLPRTSGWARRFAETLREMGTGIVYGDDCLQGERLATHWAMTVDIIRETGRMVPAPVDHLFCDNAIMDVGRMAECLRYLPDVRIEHMHPFAGKARMDVGYARVNDPMQYRADRERYEKWRADGLKVDAERIRALKGASRGE